MNAPPKTWFHFIRNPPNFRDGGRHRKRLTYAIGEDDGSSYQPFMAR